MAPNRFRFIAKCILSSYALFVIYICTAFIVSAYWNTKSTHFTYLTVDLFAELHEPIKKNQDSHVFSYVFALESIVTAVSLLITMYVPDTITRCNKPTFPGAPIFALLQIVLTSYAIWINKSELGLDAPFPVYLVLALVTITSFWLTYNLCNAYYDRRYDNAQDVECDKVHNVDLVPNNIRNQGRENAPNAEDDFEFECV